MKTLWRKNQENSSDRISHTWAPLRCKQSDIAPIICCRLSLTPVENLHLDLQINIFGNFRKTSKKTYC
jgi:hypothetical protein